MPSPYQHPAPFSHKEFMSPTVNKPHHETAPVSRPFPQFYRIILRSKDRVAGSTRNNAVFHNVTISERLKCPTVLFVESFSMENKDSGAYTNEVLEMRLTGLPQPRTWDSTTQTTTDLLAVVSGYTYYHSSPNSDSVGIPITDPNQFQNSSINIYFRKADSTPFADDFAGDWTLVLDVVTYDGSVPSTSNM